MPQTDIHLLQKILAGDRRALDEVFRTCRPAVIRLVLDGGGSRDEAEDIFITGLEKTLENVQKSDFSLYASLKTYLYAVCRNLLRNEQRRKNYLDRVTNLLAGVSTYQHQKSSGGAPQERDLEDAEMQAFFDEKLRQMPDRCRQMLTLAFREWLDNDELCSRLGMENDGKFRTAKSRCITAFLESVQSDGRWEDFKSCI